MDITQLNSWIALKKHYRRIKNRHMREMFKNDNHRFERFSIDYPHFLFDFSKNRILTKTIDLLVKFAEEMSLKEKINDLFNGNYLNSTENRPALHTALRDLNATNLFANGQNIVPLVKSSLTKLEQFVTHIQSGQLKSPSGDTFTTIVNIGIGGSHYGPLMTTHALKDYQHEGLDFYFVSNIDGDYITSVFQKVNPKRTLFIIASKSFTTLETLTNAKTVKSWLKRKLNHDVNHHFVAVTANIEKARAFGIDEKNIFPMWDWVGGRYSIWSCIGLPLALSIGFDNFKAFLKGAYDLDCHFKNAPFDKNIPVMMGLLGIWYRNFFNATNYAIAPYSYSLNFLRHHIQQLEMESNGKMISQQGNHIRHQTAPVVFGGLGCDGQHAYYQLFHQGTDIIPVDFIVSAQSKELPDHQDILVASVLSQSQALMQGKTYDEALNELQTLNLSQNTMEGLAKHKTMQGNKPSNIFFLNKITPESLGALIAAYEHKTFVQGVLWGVNSFDQWGVELGKQLLPSILETIQSDLSSTLDNSTASLTYFYKKMREPIE